MSEYLENKEYRLPSWPLIRFDKGEENDYVATLTDAELITIKIVLTAYQTTLDQRDDLTSKEKAIQFNVTMALGKISRALEDQLPKIED